MESHPLAWKCFHFSILHYFREQLHHRPTDTMMGVRALTSIYGGSMP